MVVDPRITPRDRQLVAALGKSAPDVDPVEYAAWVERPEIQRVLTARQELYNLHADLKVDQDVRFGIDALKSTIEANKDLADPLKRAETRRAATTILHICTTILRGTPSRPRFRARSDAAAPLDSWARTPRAPVPDSPTQRPVAAAPAGTSREGHAPRPPSAPSANGVAHATCPAPTPSPAPSGSAANPAHSAGLGELLSSGIDPSILPAPSVGPAMNSLLPVHDADSPWARTPLRPRQLPHTPTRRDARAARSRTHSPAQLVAAAGLPGPAP